MKEAGPTMKPESYIQGPEGERRGTPPSKQIRPFRLSGNGGKNNFWERLGREPRKKWRKCMGIEPT